MSQAGGRMTTKRTQAQSFIVADSSFELEIEDVKEIQGGKQIASDKFLLLNLSDATWTIAVKSDSNYTHFVAYLQNFPEELKSKSKGVLSVSCGSQIIPVTNNGGSVRDSQFFRYCNNSFVHKHYVDNTVTFKFRLEITCEEIPIFRRKFYDPQIVRDSILNTVSNMLGDPTFADFTFIVGGKEFKVHMNILAAASPVMKRMFTTDMEEAKTKTCTVDAITADTFDHLLRFVYNGDIPENLNAEKKPLYEAAHYYEIEKLEKICAQEIYESLSTENALEVYEWVQPYDDFQQLRMDAWKIIKRDILKIFVEIKDEPLPLESIEAIIKQKNQEKKFWEQFEKEPVEKVEKST